MFFQLQCSVYTQFAFSAIGALIVTVRCCSLCLYEKVQSGVKRCVDMWACVCMQVYVGAFLRMCNSMQTSTLLHNQIIPVFISGMINGLGRMEAGSTKDSFGYLTIFYV